MSCTTGIAKNITSDCTTQPVGGLEAVAYIFNRDDMTITYDGTNASKVTTIAKAGSDVAYKYTGVKKNLNAGHDRVVQDELADTFAHYFALKGFEVAADSIENMDGLNNVCVVVEFKHKPTDADGTFVAYGLKSGLYPSSDVRRANENNGVRAIELQTRDGEGEPYSQYNVLSTDYATTKSMLEGLLT